MTLILVAIGLVLILIELLTVSTFFVWIAAGVFAAAFTSVFTDNIYILLGVGTLVTIICLASLQSKYINYIKPKNATQTSYNNLIGRKAKMLDDYHADGVNSGSAKVGGVTWSVVCENERTTFTADETVIIKAIEGSKLIIGKEE